MCDFRRIRRSLRHTSRRCFPCRKPPVIATAPRLQHGLHPLHARRFQQRLQCLLGLLPGGNPHLGQPAASQPENLTARGGSAPLPARFIQGHRVMVVPLAIGPGRAGPARGGVMAAAEHGHRPRQGMSLIDAEACTCGSHQRHQPQVLIKRRLAQLIHDAQQMLAFAGNLQIEVLPGGLAQQSHQGGAKHRAAQAADAARRQRLIRRAGRTSC